MTFTRALLVLAHHAVQVLPQVIAAPLEDIGRAQADKPLVICLAAFPDEYGTFPLNIGANEPLAG